MSTSIGNTPPFVPPPPPPPPPPKVSFLDLLKGVFDGGPKPPAGAPSGAGSAPTMGQDQTSATGTIERPTDASAPVGGPSSQQGNLASLIGQVASKLLGKPLDPMSQMKIGMDLAAGIPKNDVIKSLVRSPLFAQGLAGRALGLVASGKVTNLLKGKLPSAINVAKSFFKGGGGIFGALKALKTAFKVPSVAKIPTGATPPVATPSAPVAQPSAPPPTQVPAPAPETPAPR